MKLWLKIKKKSQTGTSCLMKEVLWTNFSETLSDISFPCLLSLYHLIAQELYHSFMVKFHK